MKITVNQYAKSLYAATKEKSQKEIADVVSNFVAILSKNRQVKLFPKISKKFEEIWNKENGIAKVEIVSMEKLNEKILKSIEKFIEKKYPVKKVILNNIVDEKIMGGIIIKVGDEILDGSVLRQLRNLKTSLEK